MNTVVFPEVPEINRGAGARSVAAPRFRLEALGSITLPSAPAWLVRDILPASGLAVAFGEPGCGKSFAVLDAALHIAAGSDYAGRRVRKVGVVYVAAEAGMSFRRRIVAARQHLALTGKEPFALIAAAPNLGAQDGDVGDLYSCITQQAGDMGWKPGLIIIDTLARVMAGSDENSATDMGRFVGNCGRLADRLGCLVLAVHHVGKNTDAGMRGSSALHGAADAEWCVSNKDGMRSIRLVKSKEGSDNISWSFQLETVEAGEDEDGEPLTTCVVANVSDAAFDNGTPFRKAKGTPESLKLWVEAFNNASASFSEDVKPFGNGPSVSAVDQEHVRAEFYSRHPADSADARRQAFYRLTKSATERGLFQYAEKDGRKWLWRV